MGTNFYEARHTDSGWKIGVHIGKRSAAGLYCWDCNRTLCKKGNLAVHSGRLQEGTRDWFFECPECHKNPQEESWNNSSVARELGFNKSKPHRKTGVGSCSSFSWAIIPGIIKDFERIIDEYGKEYSLQEFNDVLEECPIRFFDSIGTEFS